MLNNLSSLFTATYIWRILLIYVQKLYLFRAFEFSCFRDKLFRFLL